MLQKLLYLLACISMLLSCKDVRPTFRIAAAANLKNVLDSISILYEKQYGQKPEIVYGASGKLAHQIDQQAPFDMFLSADDFYPKQLKEKHPEFGTPQAYAYARIALASKNIDAQQLLKTLKNQQFTKLAIPNPKTAPYGRIAVGYLKNIGIYESINSKIVYAENVLQTQQFITSGVVDLGITALSVCLSQHETHWLALPQNSHPRLTQELILVAPEKTEAKQFTAFLKSKTIQEHFKNSGYELP